LKVLLMLNSIPSQTEGLLLSDKLLEVTKIAITDGHECIQHEDLVRA
jgi:hypothetical protein